MNVSEFRNIINIIADDIGCDGGKNSGSHNIPSSINFSVENDDSEYELVDVESDRLIGCNCAVGIRFKLRKVT